MAVTSKTHEDFSERFNLLLDKAGIAPKGEGRQYRLEKMFKVSNKAAWKWISGESIPRLDTLNQILTHFSAYPTSIDWLLSGNPECQPAWLKSLPNKSVGNNNVQLNKQPVTANNYVKKPIEQKVCLSDNEFPDNNSNKEIMNLTTISSRYNIKDPRLIVALQHILDSADKDADDVCAAIEDMLHSNNRREPDITVVAFQK